jgi:hypothetical protein
MKVLAFIVFLLVVLWFVRNVHEGATNPPPTPQQIYDILKLTPNSTILTIINENKRHLGLIATKTAQLKVSDPEYSNKRAKLQEDANLKGSLVEKLETISKDKQKMMASAYMAELKAANPNLM